MVTVNNKRIFYISGAATLMMSVVLLMVSTLMVIFAANYGILQDKAISNITDNEQAYDAAEAGLEYAINYLDNNSSTILANPVSGYIQSFSNSNTTNVRLANNSTYSFSYTNPVQNNYELIKISSTGSNADGSASRTVMQLVQFGALLETIPALPMRAQSSVALANNSVIENIIGNKTIDSASTVSLTNNAMTILSSGESSNASALKADVTQNDLVTGGLSNSDYFAAYFGQQASMISSLFANSYSNSANTKYHSKINNLSATSIWINQTGGTTATINNSNIGTFGAPVLLVVNGNSTFTGNVSIYGFLYTNGSNTISSGATVSVNGGFATTGTISGPGTLQVYYSPSILNTLQTEQGIQYYAKIPGSWKDF